MAEKIPNYAEEEIFSDIVRNVTTDLEKVDVNDPSQIFLDKNTSLMQILKIQSETHSETLRDICEYLKNVQPPQNETVDTAGLITENAGEKVSVQAKKDFLDNIAKKNILRTRVLQKIEDDKEAKTRGSYINPTRETIIEIPESISTGTVETISDSGLKLLKSFQGDTDHEAQKFQQFLNDLFDVAETNDLSEKAVIKVLKRKLENNARQLLKKIMHDFAQKSKQPTLKEIVLRFEDRYCSELQPEVAKAKLSIYKKGKNQPYQLMEGDIHELCHLAVRGEEVTNTAEWIQNKETAVFKQAISDEDRKIINTENQTRILTHLPELTVTEMTDLLMKRSSDAKAYTTASNLINQPKIGDSDSIQQITEHKSKRQIKREKAQIRKAAEENKIEEKAWALLEQHKNNFSSNRGRGRGRGGYHNRNNGRFQNSNQNSYQNSGGGSGYSNNNGNNNGNNYGNNNGNNYGNNNGNNHGNNNGRWKNNQNGSKQDGTKPRKFVTPQMANTDPHSCLKCNSPNHRFSETDKCIYGNSNLMVRACSSCGVGAHHWKACISNIKPPVGAPMQKPQEPLDQQFSKYPDMTKNVPEKDNLEHPFPKEKNGELPPLFPW